MKVTVIPIMVGALGRIFKGLVNGLGRLGNKRTLEDLKITELLRSVRIL